MPGVEVPVAVLEEHPLLGLLAGHGPADEVLEGCADHPRRNLPAWRSTRPTGAIRQGKGPTPVVCQGLQAAAPPCRRGGPRGGQAQAGLTLAPPTPACGARAQDDHMTCLPDV